MYCHEPRCPTNSPPPPIPSLPLIPPFPFLSFPSLLHPSLVAIEPFIPHPDRSPACPATFSFYCHFLRLHCGSRVCPFLTFPDACRSATGSCPCNSLRSDRLKRVSFWLQPSDSALSRISSCCSGGRAWTSLWCPHGTLGRRRPISKAFASVLQCFKLSYDSPVASIACT